MTERALSTEAQILNVGGSRNVGTATLELRGNALVLHYARKVRLVTRCFSVTGATREFRPSYPIHLLWYGLTAAVFTLVAFGPLSARVGLDIGSPALLFLFELSAVFAGLWWLVHRFPTSVIEFRFNTEDGVFSLIVKDDCSKNHSLATLAEHFRPFEQRYHQYRDEPSAFICTDQSHLLPFRGPLAWFEYLFVFVSFLLPVLSGYTFQDIAPRIALFCYCYSPIHAVLAVKQIQIHTRPSPPIEPVEFSAQGNALKFLQQGKSNSAIEILVNFLADTPEATYARKLLAQIYISLARCDDALDLFKPLPDSACDMVRKIVSELETMKNMTRAGMTTND